MTIVSIRQPIYLPYLGFFKKIQSSDVFVFLDDVQYERGDFDNRNKIRTNEGFIWLTVPVYNKSGQTFMEAKIVNSQNWSKKQINAIEINYRKAPYFEKYCKDVFSIFEKKFESLIDLNLEFIKYFMSVLDLKTKTIRSSKLGITYTKSERLLEICKRYRATVYLSGELGKNYLDERIFHDAGIKILYEKFQHPTYNQIHGSFIPNMSIIDLLFNEGDKSKEILLNSKNL
jgi:hypothetical protein